MLVLVRAYPGRAVEVIKYLQIISRTEAKFKGLTWLYNDEQFRRCSAHDLSLNWGLVDLELWTQPSRSRLRLTSLLPLLQPHRWRLTYLRTECVSFVPSLASAQQLVLHFGPLRLTPFGWVSPLLLLARLPRFMRLPLCNIIFIVPHLLRSPFSLSNSAGSLPDQRSFPSHGISCV